jgi:hypothetical protein
MVEAVGPFGLQRFKIGNATRDVHVNKVEPGPLVDSPPYCLGHKCLRAISPCRRRHCQRDGRGFRSKSCAAITLRWRLRGTVGFCETSQSYAICGVDQICNGLGPVGEIVWKKNHDGGMDWKRLELSWIGGNILKRKQKDFDPTPGPLPRLSRNGVGEKP